MFVDADWSRADANAGGAYRSQLWGSGLSIVNSERCHQLTYFFAAYTMIQRVAWGSCHIFTAFLRMQRQALDSHSKQRGTLNKRGPRLMCTQPGSRPKSDPSYRCIHSPDVGIPPSFVIRVCYQPRSKSRPVILRCSPSSDRRLAPQWLGSSPPFTASRLLSQANMMSLRDPPALTSSSELRDLSLKPDVYPARITIIHTQLRDLICPLERAKVLHPRGTTIEQLSWTVPDEGDDGHLKTSVCSFEKGAVADGRSTL